MISYADAMRRASQAYPSDADTLVLSAAAEMELCKLLSHGYFPVQTMDKPRGGFVPRAERARVLLEKVMTNSSNGQMREPTVRPLAWRSWRWQPAWK